VPLFVEELTKVVLESGPNAVEAETAVAAVPSAALAVPATLQASLMARLDRLGTSKQTAQIGAAIGRDFSYELLAAVAGQDEAELQSALDRLVEAGLMFSRGKPPQATFLFKHSLIQDTAYGSLLRGARRDLHARIANTLKERFPDAAEAQPEVVAHHYTEAGLIAQAAEFWGKAGEKSIARSALAEAVTQLTRAVNQIASVTLTPALRREQVRLQLALASVLMHVKGYSSPEVIAAWEHAGRLIDEAESLGERSEDPHLRLMVTYGIWAANYVAINDTLLMRAKQVLSSAEQLNATGPLLIGNRLMGVSLLMVGQFDAARAHLDRAVALYAPEQHRPLAARFGQDIGVAALVYRALLLWLLGYPEAAQKDIDAALGNARSVGQAGTLMYALCHVTLQEILSGQVVSASAHVQELNSIAEDQGAPLWRAFALILRGWTSSLTNPETDATNIFTTGLAACAATGGTVFNAIFLSALASVHARWGRFDQAESCLARALRHIAETKEKWLEADIHRTAGELALAASDRNGKQAEAHFQRALSIAREQGAKSLELRAATSLARLWCRQRRDDRARDLLAPVYAWFTEGFDSPDLQAAKALLAELGADKLAR
jgi:predicted ATPase